MIEVKADLHVHTVLSPCADLSMGPVNIVNEAIRKGLKIIGITDHNSTKQCATVKKLAQNKDLFVLQGAEITTREEVHCLTFFENDAALDEFQKFIESKQPKITYDTRLFGYQVVVDENEDIKEQINYYLGVALDAGIDEVEKEVHRLNGIFIPAHINRSRFSLTSQLGFVPADIKADALEIFNRTSLTEYVVEHKEIQGFTFLKNSDSHFVQNIGSAYSTFFLEEISFSEIKMALAKKDGRKVVVE